MLLLYILWDDWLISMISGLNEQLQQQLEYTLLKPDCHSYWISKMQSELEDTLEGRYAIKLCFKPGKNARETYGMLQTAFRPCCMNQASVFELHKDSRKAGSLWGMMRGVGGVRKSIHQSWLAKGLGLGLLCRGFKRVQEEIPWEEASTLQIGSVAFPPGQCRTLPIVQTLLSVTFAYSLSSETVVMRQLRRWKRLWRRLLTRSHKRNSMGPSRSCWNGTTSALQPEEITMSIYLCRHTCMHKQTHTHKHTHTHTHIYIYIYIWQCLYIYIFIHTSTYIYFIKTISIYTYIY